MDNRLWEYHAFENDGFIQVAQRIARSRLFQTNRSCDITRENLLQFFSLISVHLQNPANTLFLTLDRVVDRVASFDRA